MNRRRYSYSADDRRRWLGVGALVVASAATLGYLYGKYCERGKKNGIMHLARGRQENDGFYQRDYNILVYGDSTTWGYCPSNRVRLKSRYPIILENELNKNVSPNGHKVRVISEGLCGRTTNERDLEGNEKNERRQLSMNGTKQLFPILYSHKPIDIVIILLGINDCKAKFCPSPTKIANNIHSIIDHCINAEIWPIDETSVCQKRKKCF